ncbi:unnamed protein product [Calicophoron daubneyi]|uniref:Uncharacterized protein n=1 Tax=Calicophoron daubneyi TaxID=300641 RepID=A0AAV2U060_CALDB
MRCRWLFQGVRLRRQCLDHESCLTASRQEQAERLTMITAFNAVNLSTRSSKPIVLIICVVLFFDLICGDSKQYSIERRFLTCNCGTIRGNIFNVPRNGVLAEWLILPRLRRIDRLLPTYKGNRTGNPLDDRLHFDDFQWHSPTEKNYQYQPLISSGPRLIRARLDYLKVSNYWGNSDYLLLVRSPRDHILFTRNEKDVEFAIWGSKVQVQLIRHNSNFRRYPQWIRFHLRYWCVDAEPRSAYKAQLCLQRCAQKHWNGREWTSELACRPVFYGTIGVYQCIQPYQLSDGSIDCPQGEDENLEMCRQGDTEIKATSSIYIKSWGEQLFYCLESRAYIPRAWVCDKIVDCPKGEDEFGAICQPFENMKSSLNATYCPSDTFACVHDAICLPYMLVCDGHVDCFDGFDETADACKWRNSKKREQVKNTDRSETNVYSYATALKQSSLLGSQEANFRSKLSEAVNSLTMIPSPAVNLTTPLPTPVAPTKLIQSVAEQMVYNRSFSSNLSFWALSTRAHPNSTSNLSSVTLRTLNFICNNTEVNDTFSSKG